jgi:hypothetical protein
MPKSPDDRNAAHKRRMAKKKAGRDPAQQASGTTSTRLRSLRQRIVENRKIVFVAAAVAVGGLAITFGVKHKAESPYCLLPAAEQSMREIYRGLFLQPLPPMPQLAKEIEISLNDAFFRSQLQDSTHIKFKRTGKNVGFIDEGNLEVIAGSGLTAENIPNATVVNLKINGVPVAVKTSDRFTVAPDLSTYAIAGVTYSMGDFRQKIVDLNATGQDGTATLPIFNAGRHGGAECPDGPKLN